MSWRPLMSGWGTWIFLSKRPGRTAAGSSDPSWFVAPITMIFWFCSKPSISARIWLRVARLELVSLPVRLEPDKRLSISSIKMMQGWFLRASWKSYLTRFAPTPTNISSKSEPEQKIKLHPASPAMALARRVLPVPGSPSNMTPLNSLAPLSEYC